MHRLTLKTKKICLSLTFSEKLQQIEEHNVPQKEDNLLKRFAYIQIPIDCVVAQRKLPKTLAKIKQKNGNIYSITIKKEINI